MLRNLYFYLITFYFTNLLYGISFSPYIQFDYDSDTELYALDEQRIGHLDTGLILEYSDELVSFYSKFAYHLYDGINQKPNSFSPTSGIGYIENNSGLSYKQFNYFFATMKMIYSKNKLNIYAAFDNPSWGPGVNKIILSNKPPPFLNFGYVWHLNSKIKYEHLYGSLHSLIENTDDSVYDFDSSIDSYLSRNINAHRITYKMSDYISISLFELIVYGGRKIDFHYLLPLIPFLPIQSYLGDLDNDLLGIYIDSQLKNEFRFYATLVIDEWTPPDAFKEKHENWVIYQLGIENKNFIINNSGFIVEYIWSDYRVYNHKFDINDFYSYGYPLGFWAGPHAEQLYFQYNLKSNKTKFIIELSETIRGKIPVDYNDVFEDRYNDLSESKGMYSISVERLFKNRLLLKLGYSYIDWINSGLNPLQDGSNDLSDIIKNNYSISVKYSFKTIKI